MNKSTIKSKKVFRILLVVGFVIVVSIYQQLSVLSSMLWGGHLGGINGVYARENFESCGEFIHSYDVFRFYDDGTVLYVALCLDEDVSADWSAIKQWFHRNSDVKEISQGKFFVSQDRVWLGVRDFPTINFSGRYLKNKLILDSYCLCRIKKSMEFLKVNVEQ